MCSFWSQLIWNLSYDIYEETEQVMRCILNKDNEQLYFSKDKMCDNCRAWDWPNNLCYENYDNLDDGDVGNSWYHHNEEKVFANRPSQQSRLPLTQPSQITNIAKGTTDPKVEFLSQVQTQILIKFHLQNLDQASSSKSQPNISLSIKLELQNLDQT